MSSPTRPGVVGIAPQASEWVETKKIFSDIISRAH